MASSRCAAPTASRSSSRTRGTFQPSTPPVVDGIPPAPTGFKATPGLGTVVLEWDKPNFAYFGYAEIFRGTTNNQAQAVSVGQTTGWWHTAACGTFFSTGCGSSLGGKLGPFNGGRHDGRGVAGPGLPDRRPGRRRRPEGAALRGEGADRHQRRAGPAWHLHPHAVRGERLDRHAAAGQRGHHGRESGEPVGCQGHVRRDERRPHRREQPERRPADSGVARRAWPSSPTPTSRRPTSRTRRSRMPRSPV